MTKNIKKGTKIKAPKVSLFSWNEFVPMLLVLVSLAVIIVGLFTQMVVIESVQGTIQAFDPISYFIRVVPKEFSNSSSGLETWIEIGKLALTAVPWLLAVISTLIIFGFNVYKTARYVRYHDIVTFDYKKLTRWMFAFVLPYIMFVALIQNGAVWIKTQGVFVRYVLYSVGYGPLITFAGLVALYISNIYATREEAKIGKIDYIFKNIPYIILISMALTTTGVLFKGTQDVFLNAPSKWRTFSGYSFSFIFAGLTELHIDMFFSIALFLSTPIFIPLFARAINNSSRIIFSSILNAFAWGTFICACSVSKFKAAGTGTDAFTIGYSVYCLAILSFILLIASIASAVLKKKQLIK